MERPTRMACKDCQLIPEIIKQLIEKRETFYIQWENASTLAVKRRKKEQYEIVRDIVTALKRISP